MAESHEETPLSIDTAPQAASGEEEPRLMISKIVCENFKSYAGTKELGPFHKCFTSIVGPNGSGKSNVIDSMLFVFGYRARKIRSKKVAVLIHNSEHHQNLQSCTVSVYFQKILDLPGDAYTVVPDSEFVVSRTAHTDNSSFYQLNGKKVPFKEMATLLRRSGIDLDHNRFLILQGEVEQIALMKPKAQSDQDDGMLEFLEDIIGTSQLKEPIEVLAKRVDDLNDVRGEKLNRVKAVEREKTELEGAKNEAEHYLSLQRDMAMKQHSLYQRYIYECGQHETKAKEKKEELDAQVSDLQTALKEHTTSKKEKTKEQKKQFTAYEKLGEQDERCREQMASCETRDVRARQDLKNAKTALKKTAKNLEKEKEKLEELKAAPDKRRKEISDLEKKLNILERRKVEEEDKLTEVMESLKTATQGLQAEKEDLELKLVDLNHAVNEVKSKLDVAQVEVDLYCEQFTSKEKQFEEAKHNLSTIRTNIKEKKSELARVESTVLPTKRKELSRTDSELKVVREKAEKLSQQARSGRAQVEEARSSLQAHRSQGRVLQSLLRQKEEGTILGIHGRLGDLGAIDEKYDIAISTACGPLDHILVDTMDTAVKCVEFLRTNDVGVATFLSLDKIEHLRKKSASKITTPENVPRLYDLVRPKSDLFSTAFYFALRDTLVADSLDEATRIGLQGKTRHRVVTLEGQLIDVAGTMSGGGSKPLRGRMSSKLHSDVTPQQLAKLEETLQSDEKAAMECTRRRAELEDQFKLLKSEIAVLEDQLKKDGRDLDVLLVQEKAVGERVKDLAEQCKGQKMDPAHLAGLEEQVKSHDKEHKKALSAANKVQANVQRLHDQIMEVSGGRMQQQQAQVDAVCKDIDEANAAITKSNVAIKTAERNTKKCESKIVSLEKELQETEAKRESLKEELTALEEEAKEVIQRQEELRVKVKEYEEILRTLKQEVEAIEAEEAAVQSKLMDAKHELEKYTMKLKENQQKIRHFQNEIKKLNLGEDGNRERQTEDQLASLDKQAVEYEITVLEERLKQMTPNMAAIEEYKKKDEIHQVRLKELDGITTERNETRMEFERLRKQRLDEFMAGFSIITNKLKEMYQMITLGGDAELELVDSLDPFSEGIVFSVRPPKKSWKNISNLSGGEKTLSSLALVFALHHYKPSPLYVMDEIDAALDFKNVSIVAHYIKERTKNAQFIIISLRNNMFELADRLVGIYKTHDATKSVTIDPYKIASGARAAATVRVQATEA